MKLGKQLSHQKTGTSREIFSQISWNIFIFFLILYLFFAVAETAFPGFITNTLKFDFLLAIVVITGIINIFVPPRNEKNIENNKSRTKNYFQLSFLAIAGSLIIYYITKDFSDISWILTILSGLIIIALGFILILPNEELVDNE